MSDNYKAALEVAEQTRAVLLRIGLAEDLADEIQARIAHAAGSLLPPVSGTFNINLTDTKVN